MKRKDLIGLQELDREEILTVLEAAESFREIGTREIKKVPALRGKTIMNLFFEPSTRTRTSFELAAKRLSADVVTISAGSSSTAKGETLLDTAKNLQAMTADIIVLRHPASGASHFLAQRLSASVINAGDGSHEHPTQGLLDLLTIREKKGTLAGLTVAILGDVARSRVARSDIHGLTKMGAVVRVVAPATMLPSGIEKLGVQVFHHPKEGLAGADVIIVLRLQLERGGKAMIPGTREYSRLYGLTPERVRLAASDVLILHPGPINRGVEIAPSVADGLSSAILNQVTNGLAVRMAVLYLLSGVKEG